MAQSDLIQTRNLLSVNSDKDFRNSPHHLMTDESWKVVSVSQTNLKTSSSQSKYGRYTTPNHWILNNKFTPALTPEKYNYKMVKNHDKIQKSLDTHKFTGFNLKELIQSRYVQTNALKASYSNLTEKCTMKKKVFNNFIGASHENFGLTSHISLRNKEDFRK